MSERKGGKTIPPAPGSDPKGAGGESPHPFVQTLFKKGAEFTDELVRENEKLRRQLIELESQNAALRTQLASDDAIRELLRTVEQLEREKQHLLSHVREQEAVSTRFYSRQTEIEEELSNLANLYVASYQLHSTLKLPRVIGHLHELLAQLVGARAHAFFVASSDRTRLVPVAADGITELEPVAIGALDGERGTRAPEKSDAVVARVYLTGEPHLQEGAQPSPELPVACIPMRIDEAVVGVIVVYSLLEQKHELLPVDLELFKMLGAHAATALMGALLFEAEGRSPGFEALHSLGG